MSKGSKQKEILIIKGEIMMASKTENGEIMVEGWDISTSRYKQASPIPNMGAKYGKLI